MGWKFSLSITSCRGSGETFENQECKRSQLTQRLFSKVMKVLNLPEFSLFVHVSER